MLFACDRIFLFYELIETLWNVNNDNTATVWLKTGINRNIVECKSFCPGIFLNAVRRINRNIVECKSLFGEPFMPMDPSN